MSSELRLGWAISTIGEVARVNMGQSPSSSMVNDGGDGLPFIQGNAEFGARFPSPRQFCTDCPKTVDTGDILLSVRAPVGELNIAPDQLCIGRGLAGLRSINGDQNFLYYALGGLAHVFARLSQGSTFDAINGKDLRGISLALPPLDEQRQIAEVLRSVDEAIAATHAVYEAVTSAQSATFETFLQSGNVIAGGSPVSGWATGRINGVRCLPTGWQIVKLVDVARLESGHTPDRKVSDYWDGGDVEWLSLHDTQNLERRDIGQTEMRISRAGLANSSARLLPPGTVCFSRTATVGKCVIMAKSMATSQDFANFVCSHKLNNRYLLHLMRWMQPIWKQLASGSTHKTIYMPTFKALQIILPPRAEQDQIAASMDSFVSLAEDHAASLIRLRSMKAAILADLLSGRVRVPVQSSAPVKTVPAAFKRAVFAAEIVHQLHNDNRFGAVKHEKIVHLCELHLDLHNELDRHAYKKAAGPYDPVARRSVEQIFQRQKWFATAKLDGKRVVYSALDKAGDHRSYFDRYFGEQRASIQSIIDLLRPLDTERCEMIATAYAVWNDFMIDGHQPSDTEIVASILSWHPRKARISEDRWSAVLPWMRQEGLVPRGTGEKTRTGPE